MKNVLLFIFCCCFLAACFHSKASSGRVGQMYFATISFTINEDDIDRASYKRLDKAVKVYKKNPAVKIEVRGYADATGIESGNVKLSQQRADKVSRALQIRGVPADHIIATGYGSAKPIASNHTPEGRQQNRRVEIEFPYPEN